MQESIIHSSLKSNFVPLNLSADDIEKGAVQGLAKIGINISQSQVKNMMSGLGMDSNDVGILPSPMTGLMPNGAPTPIQFLQEWLQGFVFSITKARKIDQLIGLQTVGSWEDEEIIQGMAELAGSAIPYSDNGNIPLASWNATYARRSIVRFEMGFSVDKLEEARTAKTRINTANTKRKAVGQALEICRNRVGFYGYNNGVNLTYGFLNEPNMLPAYTVMTGAGGDTKWNSKDFMEITADFRMAMANLQVISGDNIDPEKDSIRCVIPTGLNAYLSVTQANSAYTVRSWLRENFPSLTIETAPELNDAVGGENVTYFYLDDINDGISDDDGRVWSQLVPTKFKTLGVENSAKRYLEDYSNATAGALLKRPYSTLRIVGF